MAHLKKDFKHHKIFLNKYVDQTYLAYLYRDKIKYIPRSDDFIPHHLKVVFNFFIVCNNAICKRGSVENSIKTIHKYFGSITSTKFYQWVRHNIDGNSKYIDGKWIGPKDVFLIEIADYMDSLKNKNEIHAKEIQIIRDIYYWKDNFEDEFERFKDYVFDFIVDFDKNHYDWVVGDNIIYDRSIRDNIQKRVYCTLGNENVVPKFKTIYFENAYVEPKDKARLYKQIDYLLTTIADVNNYLLTKENVKAIELLQDYFEENEKMETCKDIYYLKIYYQLHDVYNLISQGKNHEGLVMVQEIIEKENNKYISSFTLFESVAIDLGNSTYAKIVNI